MATADSTEQGRAVRADEEVFCVKAIQPIQTPRRLISPGDYLVIDPAKRAVEGSMVLRGNGVELWGGGDYRGVVVATVIYDED